MKVSAILVAGLTVPKRELGGCVPAAILQHVRAKRDTPALIGVHDVIGENGWGWGPFEERPIVGVDDDRLPGLAVILAWSGRPVDLGCVWASKGAELDHVGTVLEAVRRILDHSRATAFMRRTMVADLEQLGRVLLYGPDGLPVML